MTQKSSSQQSAVNLASSLKVYTDELSVHRECQQGNIDLRQIYVGIAIVYVAFFGLRAIREHISTTQFSLTYDGSRVSSLS